MHHFITNVILFSIMVNSCLLSSLPMKNVPEALGLEMFLKNKKDLDNDTIAPEIKVAMKRNSFNGIFSDRKRRSIDGPLVSLHHGPSERLQSMGQFSEKNLVNNQRDASNLHNLLWQLPSTSTSTSKSSLMNQPSAGNHAKTLQSQETPQLDPIYFINKPATATTGISSSDKVFIDLLHDQTSIAGSNANRFEFLPKISRPQFNSYLTGLVTSVKGMMSEKDCSLIVKMLPVLLMNSFINAISTINNLQLANSLMIPFVVLSMINFITSFSFLDEYCPGSS